MKKIFIILIFISVSIFANDNTDFSVIDSNGKIWNNKNTNGKFLVINFWATWCPPCVKEIPALVEFYDKHKDKVEILGFDYENKSKEKVIDFLESFMVDYPIVLLTNQRKEFEKFDIHYLPTSFIYNPKGKLIGTHSGEITKERLIEIMQLK